MRLIRRYGKYFTAQEWADLRRSAKAARLRGESIGGALRRLLSTQWVATTQGIAYGFHSEPEYGMRFAIPGCTFNLWNREFPELNRLLQQAQESAVARSRS